MNIRVWRKLEIEVDGRHLVGSYLYDADSRLIEVRDNLGTVKCCTSNGGGGACADVLARIMLRELDDDRRTGGPWAA